MHIIHNENYDSSIVHMQNAMARFPAVFFGNRDECKESVEPLACTNIQRSCSPLVVSLNDVEDISADKSLHNKPARIASETFVVVTREDEHTTSKVWVARRDAWMTAVIGDLERCLKGVARVFKEPDVLHTRYIEPPAVDTSKVQAKCRTSLHRALSTEGDRVLQLQDELYVEEGTSRKQVLGNNHR